MKALYLRPLSIMQIPTSVNIDELNERYEKLTPVERIKQLFSDFDSKRVLLTSSFATHSAFFLHLWATATDSKQPVHFIDTTYHFPETLEYKRKLTELYKLTVVDVKPEDWKNEFTRKDETWKKDPDYCCQINKVEPLMSITKDYDVWGSGLMRTQNEYREALRVFAVRGGVLRFYPIIDMTPEIRDNYVRDHNLPFHPLFLEGYGSVGCTHCTVKGKGREGRWVGLAKNECGLHI